LDQPTVSRLTLLDTKLDQNIIALYLFEISNEKGSDAMIIVKILMNALPEKRKELYQTLLSGIETVKQEKGCRSHDVFHDIENENFFCLIEEWETREDLENHMRSPMYGVLLGTKFLLKEPHKIQIHTISDSVGKETVNAIRGKRI